MDKESPDVKRARLAYAQAEYCRASRLPHFVPPSGICWHCGKDMTDESWRDTLQTGCRHCKRSYCE